MNKIFWAGDSTVQTNDYRTYPQNGIGQMFSLFLKEGYELENHAKNGRSTKSFMDEGRLRVIEERMGEGDFLFIQFGHNDEKSEDPTRYTTPDGTFQENLEIYISIARAKGAYPVLITPLERRCFEENGHLGKGAHLDYVNAMRETGARCQVPLVDLYAASRKALEEAGEVESRKWYMYFEPGLYPQCPEGSRDNTHLRYEGAVYFGLMIARALKEIGGRYGDMIWEEI